MEACVRALSLSECNDDEFNDKEVMSIGVDDDFKISE